MEAAGSKKAKKKKYNDISAGEGDVLNKPKKKKVKKEYDTDNCEEKEEVGVNEEYVPSQLKDEWSKEDILELLQQIKSQIPSQDPLSYSCRLLKLDWSKVQFDGHSAEECKEQWNILKGKVRKFRILGELIEDAKVYTENPYKGRKKKARHPNQPVQPLSSYMLFYMEKKNKIIKRNPTLKLMEVTRLVAEKYKNLSPTKKATFVERARVMRAEYKQNLDKFYAEHPECTNGSKGIMDKNTNKKPLTPFKLFLLSKFEKHKNDEGYNKHSCEEKYRNRWKKISFNRKCYWIRLAKEEEEKYLDTIKESMIKDENQIPLTYKSCISKEENTMLDRFAGKPEKPPKSAYCLFSTLMLQNKEEHFIDDEPKSRMKETAAKWRQLTTDEKKHYEEEVKLMGEMYKLQFASYLESLPEDKRAEELAKNQPKKKKGKKSAPSLANFLKNEPVKPPGTVFDLYKQDYCKQDTSIPKKIAYKKAAEIWKSLSKKDIAKYKRRLTALQKKYITNFERFVEGLNEDQLLEYHQMKNERREKTDISEDEESAQSSNEDEGLNEDQLVEYNELKNEKKKMIENSEDEISAQSSSEDEPESEEGSDDSSVGSEEV